MANIKNATLEILTVVSHPHKNVARMSDGWDYSFPAFVEADVDDRFAVVKSHSCAVMSGVIVLCEKI